MKKSSDIQLAGFQMFFHPGTGGNIPCRCINEIAFGFGTPLNNTVSAILASIAVNEIQHLILISQFTNGRKCRFYVIGMNEFKKFMTQQFFLRISQNRFPLFV
jgi:hypothetical protein